MAKYLPCIPEYRLAIGYNLCAAFICSISIGNAYSGDWGMALALLNILFCLGIIEQKEIDLSSYRKTLAFINDVVDDMNNSYH